MITRKQINTLSTQFAKVEYAIWLARRLPNGPTKTSHLSRLGGKKGRIVQRARRALDQCLNDLAYWHKQQESDTYLGLSFEHTDRHIARYQYKIHTLVYYAPFGWMQHK